MNINIKANLVGEGLLNRQITCSIDVDESNTIIVDKLVETRGLIYDVLEECKFLTSQPRLITNLPKSLIQQEITLDPQLPKLTEIQQTPFVLNDYIIQMPHWMRPNYNLIIDFGFGFVDPVLMAYLCSLNDRHNYFKPTSNTALDLFRHVRSIVITEEELLTITKQSDLQKATEYVFKEYKNVERLFILIKQGILYAEQTYGDAVHLKLTEYKQPIKTLRKGFDHIALILIATYLHLGNSIDRCLEFTVDGISLYCSGEKLTANNIKGMQSIKRLRIEPEVAQNTLNALNFATDLRPVQFVEDEDTGQYGNE